MAHTFAARRRVGCASTESNAKSDRSFRYRSVSTLRRVRTVRATGSSMYDAAARAHRSSAMRRIHSASTIPAASSITSEGSNPTAVVSYISHPLSLRARCRTTCYVTGRNPTTVPGRARVQIPRAHPGSITAARSTLRAGHDQWRCVRIRRVSRCLLVAIGVDGTALPKICTTAELSMFDIRVLTHHLLALTVRAWDRRAAAGVGAGRQCRGPGVLRR